MEWASGRGGDLMRVRAEGGHDVCGEAHTVWFARHDCGQSSSLRSLMPRLGFGHPSTAQLFGGDAGEIRLDVEDRSSVQHVDAADVELRAFAAKEFNDCEADRIRTARGASGEDAVRAIVDGRSAEQFESLGAIEFPEDDEMGEAFDVGEAEFELGIDVENALGIVFYAETFGNLSGVFVRTAYGADWLRDKHEYFACLSYASMRRRCGGSGLLVVACFRRRW